MNQSSNMRSFCNNQKKKFRISNESLMKDLKKFKYLKRNNLKRLKKLRKKFIFKLSYLFMQEK